MGFWIIKENLDRLMAYHQLGWCKSCGIVFGLHREPRGRLGFVVCPKCEKSLETEEVDHQKAKELVTPKTLGSIADIYLDELGYIE